jgi:tRNA 2-thiouridine synthesizing protein A
MKNIEVNAQGLACPQPVVLAKKALDELIEGEVVVLVDSENARDNVARMAAGQGCSVVVTEGSGGFSLLIKKKAGAQVPHDQSCAVVCDTGAAAGEIVYLFDADYIGSNMELGKVLVNGFLNAALSLPHTRCAIILLSNAVRLATNGSYAAEVLAKLVEKGFRILICGTCLDFFKIRPDVKVGTISNALEIMQAMTGAAKIIKF